MLQINEFSEFALTDEETLQGQLFSDQQIKVLQNQRAAVSRDKLNLKFTPNDVNGFLQQEAELQGKLGMLNYILECHDFALIQLTQVRVPEDQQESQAVQSPSSIFTQQ